MAKWARTTVQQYEEMRGGTHTFLTSVTHKGHKGLVASP